MENIVHHIDELIGKYLAGEASTEEKERVEAWVSNSAANQQYFNQIQTIFDRVATVHDKPYFDEDAAWQKVKSRLGQAHAKTIIFPPRKVSPSWWRIAASIVVVLGIGFFAYILTNRESKELQVIAASVPLSDTLPEGSKVFLNKKTKLAYSFDKKKKTHRVKLQGEAYFNIAHDDKKNFVVETDGVFIRDIGTSFNVKAYPDSSTIEVVVEDGEVIFFTENDAGITLRANGKGIYNKVTRKFTVDQPEVNALAYKTKLFRFSNSDLGTVVEELNRVYDKKIILPDHLKSCRLTVTFNNESEEEIVQVIAETLGLTVTISGERLTLEGEGCELP